MRQKEVGGKTGGNEKERVPAVLTVDADGGKLPSLIIFEGRPTAAGETSQPTALREGS